MDSEILEIKITGVDKEGIGLSSEGTRRRWPVFLRRSFAVQQFLVSAGEKGCHLKEMCYIGMAALWLELLFCLSAVFSSSPDSSLGKSSHRQEKGVLIFWGFHDHEKNSSYFI